MAGKKEEKPPRVDLVALKQAIAKVMGRGETAEEAANEGSYSALKGERSVETFGEGRKCQCCGIRLSTYNRDNFCGSCDKAIAGWKSFPWRRGELEREMAEHCLVFVREGLGKKKASGSSGEEISSASFTRASSRKTLERKKRPKGKKKRKRK